MRNEPRREIIYIYAHQIYYKIEINYNKCKLLYLQNGYI